jgi:hypothetical protein
MTDKPKFGVVSNLPVKPQQTVPERLRALADQIDAGEYGAVEDCILIWAGDRTTADCGDLSASEAHFLLSITTRQILDNALFGALEDGL